MRPAAAERAVRHQAPVGREARRPRTIRRDRADARVRCDRPRRATSCPSVDRLGRHEVGDAIERDTAPARRRPAISTFDRAREHPAAREADGEHRAGGVHAPCAAPTPCVRVTSSRAAECVSLARRLHRERRREGRRAREPIVRLLRQRAPHRGIEERRHVGATCGERHRLHRSSRAAARPAATRPRTATRRRASRAAPRRARRRRCARRPSRLAGGLLGRHVLRRAERDARAREAIAARVLERERDAEVGDAARARSAAARSPA